MVQTRGMCLLIVFLVAYRVSRMLLWRSGSIHSSIGHSYSLGIVLHVIDDSCVRLHAEEELGLMRKERVGRQEYLGYHIVLWIVGLGPWIYSNCYSYACS